MALLSVSYIAKTFIEESLKKCFGNPSRFDFVMSENNTKATIKYDNEAICYISVQGYNITINRMLHGKMDTKTMTEVATRIESQLSGYHTHLI